MGIFQAELYRTDLHELLIQEGLGSDLRRFVPSANTKPDLAQLLQSLGQSDVTESEGMVNEAQRNMVERSEVSPSPWQWRGGLNAPDPVLGRV